MTHQIDGVTTDSVTVEKFVESGDGRILVKFGDYIKDFHVSCHLCEQRSDREQSRSAQAFLAGWFETIAYMRDHRQESIDIAVKLIGISPAVASAAYDDTMPIMSLDGRFQPEGARRARRPRSSI